ncbi:sulfotransferase family protein [Hyphomonas atlantica corrig.]|uniref:sulfotransferase family protein n=1 Tax=Hyphomonas atlantica TaxID=1280948 RepID=UPI002356900A|nr:sulfotransferase [Hyphomonas atlantica]
MTVDSLPSSNDFRVTCFVAGVQKCGTTTLNSYLSDHPEMCRTDALEAHYFDNEALDWDSVDHSTYHAMFPSSAQRKTAYEVTPIYFFWEPGLKRLRAYNPDARIVLIFRDPVERAWSQWRMEIERGTEDLSFSDAIRSGRDRLKGAPETSDIWRTASYVERGFYGKQLERALTLFPREQVLLLKTDELALDHMRVLNRITDFFGTSRLPFMSERQARIGSSAFGEIPVEDASYLRSLFAEDLDKFSKLSGLDISNWRSGLRST